MANRDTRTTLEGLADALASVLAPLANASALRATHLHSSECAETYRVDVGAETGVVKLFGDDETAGAAFARECRALEGFQALDVPRLLFVAENPRAMMTRFIEGTLLSVALDERNLMVMAEFVGQWCGRLAGAVESAPEDENWQRYLDRYESGLNATLLAQQQPLLEHVTIKRLTLAHNDNALGNFLVGKDRKLYGLDFEDARMKPEGWDLVTAGHALFRRFPEEVQTISGALLRGYRLTARDSTLPDEFDQLINVLGLAMLPLMR